MVRQGYSIGRFALAFTIFGLLGLATTPASAREDVPQPQFARTAWTSLNGLWSFAFDDQNVGIAQHWEKKADLGSRQIQIPFPYESSLSGIHDTTPHLVSWYATDFTAPANWSGKKIFLHFGAVHYKSAVWLNGELLGEHIGGQTPFVFDLAAAMKPGANHIVLRSEHPAKDLLIARGKQTPEDQSTSIFYTRTSGIWQSVWLEATGANSLDSAHFTTSNDGTGSVQLALHNAANNLSVKMHVTEPTGQTWDVTQNIVEGTQQTQIAFNIAQPLLWGPGHPNLYDVTFELSDATGVIDQVNSYFGLRELHLANNRLIMNGQPLYLKLLLDQGFWPEGIWSAPNTESFVNDIRVSQTMGFNGVRKHQKLEDPRFLYWADKMGLLVSSEFASPFEFSPDSSAQFAREWTEAIHRDWNHPSIIMWVPANESWGYPDFAQKDQQNALMGMYDLTKQLDPTRFVIDNDGWEHSNKTDLFALHDYAKTGDGLRDDFADFGKILPLRQIPNARSPLIQGFEYNGAPAYLSEFAGIGFILPGDDVPSNAWGYAGLEADPAHALARLQDLYAGLKQSPALIGFCITQLTDVEQEVNGLLTYNRQPKYDLQEVSRLNATLP